MKASGRQILTTIAAAAASAIVSASGAQAADRPDDRGGMIGVGSTQVAPVPPDAFERAVLRSTATAPVPDAFERAVARTLADKSALRPDDRATARGPRALVSTVASSSPTVSDETFAWGDAVLGAIAGFGLVALGALAMLTLRSRRVILR